ncbi:butyrophilin-like protein 8 isoform X6 [Xiphophorus hellerii]|uniref:butyrophilin-like protein 8 isoform X6 n=1 Tax=Xiphophorus hellerii TaxID=8084 RepID=UPI0013B3A63E|nr:butyrophilin-like protein 8 isoform X6 [Xiphophorus hellerii]
MFLVLLVMMFLMFCCLSSSSSLRMKMISRILLLLILSSCLCAATFVVNVTQSSYQAEENHNITLEWTFTTKTQGSSRELFIICDFRSSVKSGVIYLHHDGDEFPESQHEQFSGRVQIDKDVLREGRIRLHVSRLRTEDSGLYWCDVKTEDGFSNAECRLNVTAADVSPVQRTTLDPEPEGRGRIGLHVSLLLTAAAAAALMVKLFLTLRSKG